MNDSKQRHQPQEVQDDQMQLLTEKIAALEEEIVHAKDRELRAHADYQNLQRRSREEHAYLVKVATKAMVEDLLEPLEHLTMTAEQLQNPILDMVLQKLWSVLQEHGLQELQVLGKPFDVETMEVVDIVGEVDEKTGVVVKVVKRGYLLNGQVMQHAKVVLGDKKL